MSLDVLVNQVAYSERKRVKTAIQSIVKHTKTLTPKIGNLVQNDGRVSRIIVLGGTIPIRYQGVQYNIPVEIYLGERFPAEPPRVFVRPTPNMSIKSNHKHVDLNGQVYLPSLNQWSYRSSLENMVDEASRVFSADPPLFSKPAAPAPASAAIAAASASAYPAAAVSATPYSAGAAGGSSATYSNPYIYGGSSSPSGIAAVSTTSPTTAKVNTGTILNYVSTTSNPVSSSSSSSSSSFPSSSSSVSAREKEKRAKLIDEITMRLYQELHIVHVKLGEDLDKEFKDVAYLESSQKAAKEKIEETKALVETLERAKTQVLDTKMKEVEEWAVAAAERDKLTAEERLAPSDDLSAQIVTLTAEIASYDDMIYFLERALVSSMNKTVDLPIFLKECRKIARKQFLAKAHLRKIHAVCIQDEQQQLLQQQHQQQTSAQYGSSMPTQQLYSNIYSHGQSQQQQDVYGGIPAVPGMHQQAGIPSGGSNIAAVMAASSYGRNV